ncbi:uncharacterized protein F21D5.5-like isoform X1 [Daphnia carinata]|uniref:uncharacterized protein F21D5.5-like isoform X1 n=1 Tax=Daphnia carinata TaxID=120202 RepID=UPI00257E2620|nr:uncharacterized protein F21D5.5-like isoform X1 [Daphnia carinata]
MFSCKIVPYDSDNVSIAAENHKPLILGRGPLTKIKDPRLSRSHIEVVADCEKGLLKVTFIGANACKAGNSILKAKNETVKLKHGDVIELLENQYPFRVEFSPAINQQVKSDTSSSSPEEMVGKQTNLNNFLTKRKSASGDDAVDPSIAKKQKVEDTWEEVDGGKLIIFTTEGVQHKSKIAAFDLDGTIITTQSGKVFPTNCQDWKLLFSQIPGKLKQLVEEGYKIVFITNQAGLSNGKLKPLDFRQKLSDIRLKLGVPIQAFISSGSGSYRKPAIGMWNHLTEHANGSVPVDVGSSFYCGDAAGREAKWAPGKKKDHSSVDRLLATNVGLKFYTPEEFFLGHRSVPHKQPDFEPSNLDAAVPLLEPSDSSLFQDKQEVIVLVGFPGSGKSHFAKHHALQSGYEVINRDTLGTWQKCVTALERSLDSGKSVLIDNTNPDPESRSRFVRLASARGLPCRCFVMNTSVTHALHNNKFRELTDSSHAPVSRMIFNVYKSKFQEPSLEEGFSQIVRVNFRPEFRSAEDERLYKMYLLED